MQVTLFVFVTIPSSRINACVCNFIMWFIFSLQRKNKQLEIAAADINRYMQNRIRIKRSAYLCQQNAYWSCLAVSRLRHKYLIFLISYLWISNFYSVKSLISQIQWVFPLSSASRVGLPRLQFPCPSSSKCKYNINVIITYTSWLQIWPG